MSIRKYKDFLQKSNMKIENKRAREVNLISISTCCIHINSRFVPSFDHAIFVACYGISYNDLLKHLYVTALFRPYQRNLRTTLATRFVIVRSLMSSSWFGLKD